MKTLTLTWEDIQQRINLVANDLQDLQDLQKNLVPRPCFVFGIPRGGIAPALLLVAEFNRRAMIWDNPFQITENEYDADIFIDDLVDSGATKQKWQQKYPDKHFVALYDKKDLGDCWVVFPWEIGTEDIGPEENIRRVIEYVGDDCAREGLLETPARVIKSFSTLYGGYKKSPEDIMKTFTEGACEEMVLLKNIELFSTCEHHMLPFFGRCHIAYIPAGKVIGVSKLARLMEIYSRRLQIQERIGEQVTRALDTFLQAKGSACIIEAQHFCMTSRGVEKQNSIMVTSSLTGVFRSDPQTRAELMSLIKN